MSRRWRAACRATAAQALCLATALCCAAAATAQAPRADGTLPPVTFSAGAGTQAVEKSYRRMLRGMDLFEQRRHLAPEASLRFRLLPRQRDVELERLELYVLGPTVAIPVAVAPDHSFVLPRSAQALAENALVTPERRAGTLTWRAEVRSPGLPPHTRRLGDLRLECQVGMAAGLFSSSPSWITRLVDTLSTTPDYCSRDGNRYLFFAERPLFGVTLVDGARRETLPVEQLYGGAIDDPGLRDELPYCDCEVLLDRTYFLPLGDPRWSDETRVEFDCMGDADAPG